MNLGTMRTDLQTRLGVPSGDALFTTAVCTILINDANHATEVRADWPWLEQSESINTANGTDAYTPAGTGWMRTISLTISGRDPMERVSIGEIDRMLGASGDPRFYAVYGDQLLLRPVPTSILAMKHRYVRSEPELANDSDTPLSPVSFHAAIVELAAAYGFRRANRNAEAGAAMASYEQWIGRMLARADRRSTDPGGGQVPTPPVEAKKS